MITQPTTRISFILLTGATFILSSCGWNWNKLNPTYIEPILINNNQPVLHTLDDGRDLSGYPIPKGAFHNRVEARQVVPTKESSSGFITPSSLPYGEKTSNPNQVRSPYPPHKLLDATGYPSGTIVKDPASMQSFKLP